MFKTRTDRRCISFDFDDTLAEYVPMEFLLRCPHSCHCGRMADIDLAHSGRILVCIPQFVQLLREYKALGCRCLILTARSLAEEHILEINEFLIKHNLEGLDVIFTSHEPKGRFALEHKIDLHYDDSEVHLESLRSVGVKAISSIRSRLPLTSV